MQTIRNNGVKPASLDQLLGEDNPFALSNLPPTRSPIDVTLRPLPGVSPLPTREERRTYVEGRKQLLEIYLIGQKGRTAQVLASRLEDEASLLFHTTGQRMWERTQRCADPDLHLFFSAFTNAQLVRYGQALSSIAHSTEGAMHEVVQRSVQPPPEAPRSFFDRLLGGEE